MLGVQFRCEALDPEHYGSASPASSPVLCFSPSFRVFRDSYAGRMLRWVVIVQSQREGLQGLESDGLGKRIILWISMRL